MRRSALARSAGLALLAAAGLAMVPTPAGAQLRTATVDAPPQPVLGIREPTLPKETIDRSRKMLAQMRRNLKEVYYDSTFHGIDMLGAKYHAADTAIIYAPTLNHAMAAIADYMGALNDSHTRFFPPSKVASVDYGFSMNAYGDTVYVTAVKQKSDAEKAGLKRGDALLKIDNITLSRGVLRTVQYVYYSLSPRPGMRLVVRGTDGTERDLIVKSKLTAGDRILDYSSQTGVSRIIQQQASASRRANHSLRTIGDSVLYWKMNSFVFGDEEEIDRAIALAKQHRAVVLDLRGNGGGAVETMRYVVGRFIGQRLDLYNMIERDSAHIVTSRPAGDKAYNGMLVVLIDSRSASASELTSRTLQTEGRAIIVGDRSAGAVVTSIQPQHTVGFERVLIYGANLTISDIVMPDGNRLENVGVTPDHVVVPSGSDLTDGGDIQLAKALSLVGITTDKAGAAAMLKAAKRL